MKIITIAANGDYEFENIYTHVPSVIVAQILTDGSFNGTIAFEKKAQNSALARVAALYIDDILKQVANAVINGINKNLIVIIDSSGSNVFAKVTGWSTGSCQIDYVVLQDTFPAFKVASGGGSPTADVNVISPLPIGNNNIGDVDIASIAAGDNNIGNVDIVTMPAIVLGAGTNNIGDVDVLSLPALSLAPSANNIGDVDVLTLPDVNLSVATLAALETIQIGSLPAISGTVALDAPTLAALETITAIISGAIALDAGTLAALEIISIGTALPVGGNNIGDVDVLTLPAISLGASANNIGDVDIASSVPIDLSASTLAALEIIGLDATTLAALENIKIDKQSLTGSAPLNVSVGVASGVLIAANANRKGLVVVNRSVNIVSLAFAVAAELNKGITLNASGGVWVMDEYTYSTQEIRAIASGAASTVAIQELT